MRTGLRSLVDAILARIPGKTSRLDTATRMMTRISASPASQGPPATPRGASETMDTPSSQLELLRDIQLLDELVRIVNEAQERGADDERRVYNSIPSAWPSFSRRERPDPGSRFYEFRAAYVLKPAILWGLSCPKL